MLLLMFTALVIVVTAYTNYNQSTQDQMTIEQERAQERIALTEIGVNDQNKIADIVIENRGTIEVTIRALYLKQDCVTSFVTDPTIAPLDANTHIPPGNSTKIQTSILNLPYSETTKIIAATERGTESIDYIPTVDKVINTTILPPDTSLLYIGPLILNFTSFEYHKTDGSGKLTPTDTWQPGWSVPKSTKVAWKITVENNDTKSRSITLSKYASFTIATVTGLPQVTPTWYLNSTGGSNPTQPLIWGQKSTIIFIWDSAGGTTPQSVYQQEGTCMVFLTFFGNYTNSDGTTSPYAQTIPFEAAITVV